MAKSKVKNSAEVKALAAAELEGMRKEQEALLKKIRAGKASDAEKDQAKALASKIARKK